MADCASLPNAAELVNRLRVVGACVEFNDACVLCKGESKSMCRCEKTVALQAADAIEQLFGKAEQLKSENAKLAETVDVLTEETIRLREDRDGAVNVTRCKDCHYNTTDMYKNEASNALWSDGGKKVYCSKNRRWRIKNGYCDEGNEDGKIDG